MLLYEKGDFKPVGGGYRSKKHPSLAVSEKGFYWHSNGVGGKTAVDYLVEVKGYGLVDAVCKVLGERPLQATSARHPPANPQPPTKSQPATSMPKSQSTTPPPKSKLAPPRRHHNNRRAIAYLQTRGIDRDVIQDCIDRGVLYESAMHHNVVFLGKDQDGKVQYSHLRSTICSFRGDGVGSDKRFGFVIPPTVSESDTDCNRFGSNEESGSKVVKETTNEVAIFESAIDALSHQTLCKEGYIQPFDGWRLSLGGTSPLALSHFLEQNPQIECVIICTDSDEAGDRVAARIEQIVAGMGGGSGGFDGVNISIERILLPHGTDWNDMLLVKQQQKRLELGAAQNNSAAKNYTPSISSI